MNTEQEYLEKVREAARERLAVLEQALEQPSVLQTIVKAEGMNFHRSYAEETCEVLRQILSGKTVNYAALADSISLEMISNSGGWNTLRYYARRLGWLQEEQEYAQEEPDAE